MATQKATIANPEMDAKQATSPLNHTADFRKIIPVERNIIIADETFNVAVLPVAVCLKMSDMLTFKGGITAEEMAELTVDTLRAARKDLGFVSLEWLSDPEVCDGVTFMRVIDYVMKPAKDLFFPDRAAAGETDKKNIN